MSYGVPKLTSPPDFDNLLAVLQRSVPNRPTLFEFFLNEDLYALLAGAAAPSRQFDTARLRWLIRAFGNAGYDYTTYHGSALHFPRRDSELGGFRMETATMITDRHSFADYPWPNPADFDYSPLSDIGADLPEGMKLVTCGPGGVLENAIQLVGFENLCLLLIDDPQLVSDVFERIGSVLVKHYAIVARHDSVGACISNDDWGFKTQPMLAPNDMRRYVFPWHKRIAETIHQAGKPAILHSCGNQSQLYDDIIDTLGYDAKHSYEDTIQPVESAYDQLHRRIAVLGGIDVDFMCRSTPDAIFQRATALIELSKQHGGYALGTGNSVPHYIPHEHYFAMTHAALKYR